MKKIALLAIALVGLAGCDENRFDPPEAPLEGVVSNVSFNVGEEVNCCVVEFNDGRLIYFRNGAGFMFQKGAVNRIYRRDGVSIDAVEIVGPKPGR